MDFDDQLSARFDFDSWKSVRRGERRLFVQDFFIAEAVLEDWTRVRSQALPEESGAVGKLTIWEKEGSGDRLLSVVTYEATSLEHAHSTMLAMLGDFQSPQVVRHEERVFGDVSFGDGTGLWTLFSASNIVAAVRNAGPELTPVEDVAASLVGWIEVEHQPDGKVVPQIEQVTIDPTDSEEKWLVSVTAVEPLGREVMIKIFAENGHVVRDDGRLIFYGGQRDAQSITVVAINQDRGVASTRGTTR